jgi:hypothetical protein
VPVTGPSAIPIDVGADASLAGAQLTPDSLPALIVGNAAGQVQWFSRGPSGEYTAQGPANAAGLPMTVAGSARLSLAYGAAGTLPRLVVCDASGAVYTARGVLTGDFDRDGTVGFFDYMTFVNAWNTAEGDAAYERKANISLAPASPQAIDFFDYMTFVSVWDVRL